jgi:hypothetical protein
VLRWQAAALAAARSEFDAAAEAEGKVRLQAMHLAMWLVM